MYRHTIGLLRNTWYRVDTASGSSTPTTVTEPDGATTIRNVYGGSGSTVKNTTPEDQAVFTSATQVLYLKPLDWLGNVDGAGTVVTSTGVDLTQPATPDLTSIINGLPGTYARRLSVPGQGFTLSPFFPVMAAPYTTTQTNVTGGTVTSGSTITSAVRIPAEQPGAFRYGGGGIIYGGSLSGVNMWQTYGGSAGPQQSQTPYSVEFNLDTVGGSFDVVIKRFTSAQARVAIDGQYITQVSTFVPSDSTAQPCLLNVAGLSAGRHRVRVEFNKFAGFCGVNVQASDSVLAVPVRRKRVIVVGDSYTEPTVTDSISNAFGGFGWVQALGHVLGVDAWSSGSGGTGYLAPGASARVKFRDRLTNDVIAYSPDMVIWAGGHNDVGSYSSSAIGAEAALCFSTTAAALPNCQQVVVGPMWGYGPNTVSGSAYDARDAIKAAAAAAGLLWIDPQESPLDLPAQGSGTLQANVTYRAGTWLKVGTGAAQEVRLTTNVTGSGPYTITVPALTNAHTAGDPITETGPGWVTGNGRQGTTNGSGTADRYTGSDSTHPTQAGHEALGLYVAQRLYYTLAAG
jgi:lysophospholipase L1-like esterase